MHVEIEKPSEVGSERARPGILIVEDDADILAMLGMILEMQGFAVWKASDGVKALATYRLQETVIDLVLLDVQMPGLNGVQTFTALQAINPAVRCCFMTGESNTRELLALGAVQVFAKPFSSFETARALWRLACVHG